MASLAGPAGIYKRRLEMSELGEEHRPVGQGDACRPGLPASFRVEGRGRCVEAVAEVSTALGRVALTDRRSPEGRSQVGIGNLAIVIGGGDPQAAVVQEERRFEEAGLVTGDRKVVDRRVRRRLLGKLLDRVDHLGQQQRATRGLIVCVDVVGHPTNPVADGLPCPFVAGNFPVSRPRRLRTSAAMRHMVAETRLDVANLVAPLFVREGIDEPQPIRSLPGVVQHTRESVRAEVTELADLGIGAVILFGVPSTKDSIGSKAFDPEGIVQLCLADLADKVGDRMVLMADLCVDDTPIMAIAACSTGRRTIPTPLSTTTPRWRSTVASRSPRRRPAPTSWPPAG